MSPIVIFLVSLSLVAVAALLWSGARARSALRAANPPPGRLVALGDRRIHLAVEGQNGPSIVIIPGQGDFSLSWRHIQRELSRTMRVTVFDRAGLGWSDPGPADADVSSAVEDLHGALSGTGLTGTHILVGHSYGGMVARLFAHRYPGEVAGLVLVDSSHEDQFAPELIQKTMRRMAWMMPLMMGAFNLLVRTGLAARDPARIPDLGGALAHLDPGTRAAYQAVLAGRPEHLAAAGRELRNLERSNAVMRAAAIASFGDIPLVVLRHGKAQPQMGGEAVTRLLEETFQQIQAGLAARSSRGELIVAEQSGHAIHLEQPDLVIRAITAVAG